MGSLPVENFSFLYLWSFLSLYFAINTLFHDSLLR